MGGDERIRTAGAAFAEPCLTTWRRRLEWERETGNEPATFSLARRCSTTEPLPLIRYVCEIKIAYQGRFVNNLVIGNACSYLQKLAQRHLSTDHVAGIS